SVSMTVLDHHVTVDLDRPRARPFRDVIFEGGSREPSILRGVNGQVPLEPYIVIAEGAEQLAAFRRLLDLVEPLLDAEHFLCDSRLLHPAARLMARYRRRVHDVAVRDDRLGLEYANRLKQCVIGDGRIARPEV